MKQKNKLISIILPTLFLFGCQPEIKYLPLQVKASENGEYAHCNNTVPFGFPQFRDKNKERENNTLFSCHLNYTLAYDLNLRMAYWTAEHLNANDLIKFQNQEPRKEKGPRPDINIPFDYGNVAAVEFDNAMQKGYNIRSFVSKENWLGNQKAMSKVYYWSNIFPYKKDKDNYNKLKQYQNYLIKKQEKGEDIDNIKIPELPKDNSVILWENMEKYIRDIIKKYGEGYVFSGPIFYGKNGEFNFLDRFGQEKTSNSFQEIYDQRDKKVEDRKYGKYSKNGLVAPTHFYKLIYLPKQNGNFVFIIPNSDQINNVNPLAYKNNLETLERITNLNFFPLKR